MSERVQIELQPIGQRLQVERGTPLPEILFTHGVEFPCGGHGRCQGCKVKVLSGDLPLNEAQRNRLTARDIAEGWRLACQGRADQDLVLELAQWDAAILADDSVFEFTPGEGWGIAVDIGTTTLVAQLLDLRTGRVGGVRTALNAQAEHGADIMSRVQFAMADGERLLTRKIRAQIGRMIAGLLTGKPEAQAGLRRIVLVGNTVMHHLFGGINVEPLSSYPFTPTEDGMQVFAAHDLDWPIAGNPAVRFLPCLGGFVGSDVLAGVMATRLHESPKLVSLIDLGTNGEIVLGNRDRLLCASTAAGPAFEGARISMGMRAATGAIAEVFPEQGRMQCRVLGHGPPRGICGSGLVDAVAVGLDLGWIESRGRLANGQKSLSIMPPVVLTQSDIRELQLAKGAIAAGIRILLAEWGASIAEVDQVYLAGAFGNYINRGSAARIGLFGFTPERVRPAGNTALLGAKLALFDDELEAGSFASWRRRIQHRCLSTAPGFEDIYAGEMRFPDRAK
jgi:uncharacterized 2Fe-2S/4Fe-4S cluster protein (DUF4445 family)